MGINRVQQHIKEIMKDGTSEWRGAARGLGAPPGVEGAYFPSYHSYWQRKWMKRFHPFSLKPHASLNRNPYLRTREGINYHR